MMQLIKGIRQNLMKRLARESRLAKSTMYLCRVIVAQPSKQKLVAMVDDGQKRVQMTEQNHQLNEHAAVRGGITFCVLLETKGL